MQQAKTENHEQMKSIWN